jgi:hypothetical protein
LGEVQLKGVDKGLKDDTSHTITLIQGATKSLAAAKVGEYHGLESLSETQVDDLTKADNQRGVAIVSLLEIADQLGIDTSNLNYAK